MIVPIGERYQQTFYLFQKKDGRLEQEQLISTLFVPMTGESEARRRVLPDADRPELKNGGFEADENTDDNADGWHYQRRSTLISDSPVQGSNFIRFTATDEGEVAQALQGMALNGRRLGIVDVSVWAQGTRIDSGLHRESAGITLHFYNRRRQELVVRPVVHWSGTFSWQQTRRQVAIPIQAREMIIRIGLNGAVGTLDLDDVRITFRRRSQ